MDIVSNFILHSNHCDGNRVFVKFRESADPHSCRANGSPEEQNVRLRGCPHQLFVHGYICHAKSLHIKTVYSTFSCKQMQFYVDTGHFAFLSPIWGIRSNSRCSS